MTVSAINSSAGVNGVNKTGMSKQPQNDTKSKSVSKTAIAVGLGLAALASVGIYLVTRGKAGKQIAKPEITQKTEEVVENVQEKFEKILQQFNEGPYKNAKKTVGQLKSGKKTITLGEGTNRTVYIYDKNANPEKQINFVNKGYTVNVPGKNGVWEIAKSKRNDIETGDTIIDKFGTEKPKFGTAKPIEITTISKEQNNGLTEFRTHKYIKNNDGPFDEESVSIRTMKFGNDKIRTFRKASLKPNESPEWNVQSYTLKNNERIDKRLFEILTAEQMQKWRSASEL